MAKAHGIGVLDRRITLLVPTTTVDSFQHPKETFADGDTLWASYELQMGRGADEREENKQRISFDRAVFQIRFRSDITAQHRLRFDGDEYQITAVEQVHRKKRLNIYATHRDNT